MNYHEYHNNHNHNHHLHNYSRIIITSSPSSIFDSFFVFAISEVFPVSTGDAEPVASCEEHGVLGPIVGTLGSLAALETIKVRLTGGYGTLG